MDFLSLHPLKLKLDDYQTLVPLYQTLRERQRESYAIGNWRIILTLLFSPVSTPQHLLTAMLLVLFIITLIYRSSLNPIV